MMTAAERLERVADLSQNIAYRLYEVRNWTEEDKAQHKADLYERDALLVSASATYLIAIATSRALAGEVKLAPANWRLRFATWVIQKVLA